MLTSHHQLASTTRDGRIKCMLSVLWIQKKNKREEEWQKSECGSEPQLLFKSSTSRSFDYYLQDVIDLTGLDEDEDHVEPHNQGECEALPAISDDPLNQKGLQALKYCDSIL